MAAIPPVDPSVEATIAPAGGDPVELGLAAVEAVDPQYAQEKAAVRRALYEIQQARDFDRDYITQIGIDRAYARGDSQHDVRVNLIGSAIDTMTAHLYARDPDVSVSPADRIEAPVPPMPQGDPALSVMQTDPEGAGADPKMKALALQAQQETMQAQQEWFAATEPQRQAREFVRRFSKTLEIVISQAWRVGKMKRAARKMVRGALSTSLGWLKVTWQERRGMDPVTMTQIADMQDNLAKVVSMRQALAEGEMSGTELDAQEQAIREQMVGLQAKLEVLISRGLAIDFVSADDMTVPMGLTNVLDYLDSPWLDHRVFMTLEDALSMYGGDDPEKRRKIRKATRFSQRRPMSTLTTEPQQYARVLSDGEVSVNPSQFTSGSDGEMLEGQSQTVASEGAGNFVCVHERWHRESGLIQTMMEGVECYVKPPHPPEVATLRFYPFFGLAFTEVDGTRYPQSKNYRTQGLQDEYNGRRSAWKAVRSRNKQGILFNAGACETDTAGNATKAVDGEWVAFKVRPDIPMSSVFMPKPVTPPDPGLYDTGPILNDFEREWGLQEAQQGAVDVEKTATEADIQQQGFATRTAFMREYLEEVLQDVAEYTAQIVVQRLTQEDVVAMAGPGALWPQNVTVDDLATLVAVRIRSGTTGKPNTKIEREAWAQTLPMVQGMMVQIAQMRGASPAVIADKLEKLVEITLQRSGDSLDVEELIPQAADGMGMGAGMGPMGMGGDGAAGTPGQMGEPVPPVIN